MTNPHQQDPLRSLEQRIARARDKPAAKSHTEEHYSQAQVAWRMVIELVAGLGLGLVIGYGIDTLLGTMPIFLVTFILLGFAAGVKVMMRTAREVQVRQQAGGIGKDLGDDPDGDDPDDIDRDRGAKNGGD